MATIGLGKYFDERANKILIYEDQLKPLGLIVEKSLFGRLEPVNSGGVLDLYHMQFKKTSERFSKELVEFLLEKLEFSFDDVEGLERQAVLSSKS